MGRYRLDDLGWYQFENLIQSLLKTKCGLLIESWGKGKDFGRDAYTKNPIKFPDDRENEGSFIFQVKFIDNASLNNTKGFNNLKKAVNCEIKEIQSRIEKGTWTSPNFYTLVTNFPITATQRELLRNILHDEMTNTNITIWGDNDISDLLDQNPDIRRSFPQLLSLRDLNTLIEEVVNRDIKIRSEDIVEKAKECSEVFVPTNAYRKCLEIIKKNNFVVIEGPPEAGKTAIAWMISLIYLTEGYEALLCNKSDDFFRTYSKNRKQIFIADDAFGRTEYDVTRGRLWEIDLERVLRKIDRNHLLIWTSRKNIFKRALHQMDLQGHAAKFPKKANLLVDATKLTIEERALILYRHAKNSGLSKKKNELVKKFARQIVMHKYLTPERIRFLIDDYLLNIPDDKLDIDQLSSEIESVIQKPTDRMRKSFSTLSNPHKMILLTLLGESYDISKDSLKNNFYKKFSSSLEKDFFEDLLIDLSESFIKIGN